LGIRNGYRKNEDRKMTTDYFPSSSEKGYIQDIKEEIWKK
jgi:hypothetical protein